jgi:hypothetical protein
MSIAPRSLAEARALLLSPLGPVARAGQDLSRPRVSFEFFPPKSDEAEASLWKAVTRLAPLAPEFVSVTYGAGGSTRERTHRTVQRILAETILTPAAHLTCVEASRAEVADRDKQLSLQADRLEQLQGCLETNARTGTGEQDAPGWLDSRWIGSGRWGGHGGTLCTANPDRVGVLRLAASASGWSDQGGKEQPPRGLAQNQRCRNQGAQFANP